MYLQYLIELGVERKLDIPGGSLSTADRLAKLKKLQAGWRDLKWNVIANYTLAGRHRQFTTGEQGDDIISGGFHVRRSWMGRQITIRRLQSTLFNSPPEEWYYNSEMRRGLSIEVEQDLMAWVDHQDP